MIVIHNNAAILRKRKEENTNMGESVEIPQKNAISNELKVCLNEWKEIIVLLNSILAWKNNWYPAVIVSSVTFLYLYVWLANSSLLNVIWTTGFCVTLLDCFVCGPLQKVLPADSWDQEKEHTYTAITESVTDHLITCKLYVQQFVKLRRTNMKLFHSVLFMAFFCLLYIGTTFNNLFVSYTTVLIILLFPGFKNRIGCIEESVQKYGRVMASHFWSTLTLLQSKQKRNTD